MAGTETTPGAVSQTRTPPQSPAWSGPAARPVSRLIRLEMDRHFKTSSIKAIWLCEKGEA